MKSSDVLYTVLAFAFVAGMGYIVFKKGNGGIMSETPTQQALAGLQQLGSSLPGDVASWWDTGPGADANSFNFPV